MNSHKSTIKRTPSIAVTGVLLASLAGVTAPAHADIAQGYDNLGNQVIAGNGWVTISSLLVQSANVHRVCQAVASLDALNPGGNAPDPAQSYRFTVTRDNAFPCVGCSGAERTIELRDQPAPADDPDVLSVSTNTVFDLTPNVAHIIRLLGRREPGAPNLTVDDSYLSIYCGP